MPKLNDLFPTNYLKAADFEDGDAVLTIKKFTQETLGQGRDAAEKWIVFFKEMDKGLVLNKTNANAIAKLYGDDTDDWIGRQVTLFATEVQFKDEMVEAIRIRSKPPKAAAKAKVKAAAPPREPGDDDDEDEDSEIPF